MSNPKGNPNIVKYGFKTDRTEPLRERVQIRIPTSMKEKLQEQENWQEFVRQAIAKALQEKEELKSA
ncbi:MAG: hypothetical protein AB4038_06915 [Prochloraceae cyanobacterium]